MIMCVDEIWLSQVSEGHWRIKYRGQTFDIYEMENHYEVSGKEYLDLCLTFTQIFENLKKNFQ